MITKQELQHILVDTESYHIERTISTDNADKFCQAICAFSNDLPGSGKNGYLILGAYDNGKLSGLKVEDKLLLQISNIRTDGNILPQPVMTVEKFSFKDGDVLVAEVPFGISTGTLQRACLGACWPPQKHRFGSRRKDIDRSKSILITLNSI